MRWFGWRSAGALARLHFLRGNLLFPHGDLPGCRREHERSLALAREAGAVELEVAALGGQGAAAFLQGRMLSAREHFERCVALAAQHGLRRVEAANRPMAAISRLYAGQTHAAALDADEAIVLARRIGHHRAEMIGHHGAYRRELMRQISDVKFRHFEAAKTLSAVSPVSWTGQVFTAGSSHAEMAGDKGRGGRPIA